MYSKIKERITKLSKDTIVPNRRTVYLVNPKFQLKLAFFISSLVFIVGLIYPWIIYELFEEFAQRTQNPTIIENLANKKSTLAITLGVMHMIYLGIVFVISIFQGHKIAGPVYKLNKTLLTLANNGIFERVQFRKSDNFLELSSSYNKAIEKLISIQNHEIHDIDNIIKKLDHIVDTLPEDKRPLVADIRRQLLAIEGEIKNGK